jgi:predicted nucleic acid-binding protein
VLFDSTILIDSLNGIPAATTLLASQASAVSVITYIEVLAGARTPTAEGQARDLLRALDVLPLSADVASAAVAIRRERRLKLPDAIIYATARVHGLTLVTRNTKDFSAADPGIRVPYQL